MPQGFEKEQGPDDTASDAGEAADAKPVAAPAEKGDAQRLIISKDGCELSIDPDTYYSVPDLRRSIDAFFDLIGPSSDLSALDDDEW